MTKIKGRSRAVIPSAIEDLPAPRHENIDAMRLLEAESRTENRAMFHFSISLDSLMEGRRGINVCAADCLFKQVVRGIQYLHSAGIAYRNLNPENLVLEADGYNEDNKLHRSRIVSTSWRS
jgi:serine/threonine protein kinase